MAHANINESDAQTWTFTTSAYHFDAPQAAKSKVSKEEGIDYDALVARVVGQGVSYLETYVVVVKQR